MTDKKDCLTSLSHNVHNGKTRAPILQFAKKLTGKREKKEKKNLSM